LICPESHGSNRLPQTIRATDKLRLLGPGSKRPSTSLGGAGYPAGPARPGSVIGSQPPGSAAADVKS